MLAAILRSARVSVEEFFRSVQRGGVNARTIQADAARSPTATNRKSRYTDSRSLRWPRYLDEGIERRRADRRTLDVKNMSAGAIAEETKNVRTRTSKRGRGVSEADRKRVAALAKSLRALGLTATVALKAGLMNREAKVAIVAPLSELHALAKSLARS
jgi:hypothetical protein